MTFTRACALAAFVVGFSSLGNAQATRTWVSGVGDDANPCSRTAPCKTFAGAISKTASSGEINCLDPGGFGGVTITKSITIDCDGTFGSILVSGTNAIVVAAGSTDEVALRGLFIDGVGTGLNGVRFTSGRSLSLERVTIFGFATNCVDVQPGNNPANIRIAASSFHDCSTDGLNIVTTNSSTVNADLNDVRIASAGTAVNAGNGARVTIHNSVLTQNAFGVKQPTLSGGGGSQVVILASTISGSSNTALQSVSGGYIGISGSTLSYNTLMFSTNGGTLLTGGDNVGFGNSAIGSTSGTLPRL